MKSIEGIGTIVIVRFPQQQKYCLSRRNMTFQTMKVYYLTGTGNSYCVGKLQDAVVKFQLNELHWSN